LKKKEGGGNRKGEKMEGFQLWLNVPSEVCKFVCLFLFFFFFFFFFSKRKMDDPKYGTVSGSNFPVITEDGVNAIVLAGNSKNNLTGPFQTVQPVQMADMELQSNKGTKFFCLCY
jgi:redox-sensitive bicupin YhaK (pirin superfamily)